MTLSPQDTTSLPNPDGAGVAQPEFWSLEGVLAICAVLILTGAFIDWILRKRHQQALLRRLAQWEIRLASLPVREWQIAIAGWGVRFWERLLGGAGRLLAADKRKEGIKRFLSRKTTTDRLRALGVALALLSLAMQFGIPGEANPIRQVLTRPFSYESFIVVPASMFFGLLILIVAVEAVTGSDSRPSRFLAGRTGALASSAALSGLFTLIALLVGTWIAIPDGVYNWFIVEAGRLYPEQHLLLPIINYPFDFLTILISISLLRWVVRAKRFIALVALLDIAVSAVLSISLHALLKVLDPQSQGDFAGHFMEAAQWFFQVVTLRATASSPDWALTPILLTTFIPVVMYMSAFVVLGLVVSPLARLSGYVCGVLSEKEKTPFAQLAILLSLLTVAAKALWEWDWFVSVLT